jgi:hypothetical protein
VSRREFVQDLTDKCVAFTERLCDVNLYTYQRELVDRIFFSLIYGDAEEITIEQARQSGKTEGLACTAAGAMVILPKLAKMFPDDPVLRKFKNGVMVGIFGPIELQSETLYTRIGMQFESEVAREILGDPEIAEPIPTPSGKLLKLKESHSFCRMQTAHPKAKIESKTYHLIIIDEAQEADSATVRKSIHPMLTATAGTIVKAGTPFRHKSDFLEAIGRNKRRGPTNGKKNHFAVDFKRASRENPFYAKSIEKEKERLGEDSDEFQMSYNLKWMLDRGMFITEDRIEELGDQTMQIVPFYADSPIVMGIDVARKHDSTVVTALWVDWERPDEFGLYDHRILNWLELHGENWEAQYQQICEFISRYRTMRIGVDAQGMGEPVAERLAVLLPNVEVVPLPMNPVDQTERWQHLMQLIQRGLIGWPAHPRTRRLKVYQRFIQQLAEVEKEYKGRYVTVGAPRNERNAHDDFIDSLALACSLTKEFGQALEVEVWNSNPFLERYSLR